MYTRLEQLLQKQMSRKEFLITLGLGLIGILGFSGIIRLFEGKASVLETGGNAAATTAAGAADISAGHGSNKPRKRLIRGGHVLTMDGNLGEIAGGDVLLDRDKIVAVGRNLKASGAKSLTPAA